MDLTELFCNVGDFVNQQSIREALPLSGGKIGWNYKSGPKVSWVTVR